MKNEPFLLIADDDREMRESLKEVLSRVTPNILLANDALHALRVVITEKVATIVLDVQMEGMSGLELARHLRQIGSQIPIVLLSGNDDFRNEAKQEALQPAAFVAKPFTNSDLRRVVEQSYQIGLSQRNKPSRRKKP